MKKLLHIKVKYHVQGQMMRFQKAEERAHVLLRNREKGALDREWPSNTRRKAAGGRKSLAS